MTNPNEGTIWQRLMDGTAPSGMSINGKPGGYGTIGNNDHVTVWDRTSPYRRSWDNPGPTGDHSTNQQTGRKTQH